MNSNMLYNLVPILILAIIAITIYGPKKIWVSWLYSKGRIYTQNGFINLETAIEISKGIERKLSPREIFYYKTFLSESGLILDKIQNPFPISFYFKDNKDTMIRSANGSIFNIQWGHLMLPPKYSEDWRQSSNIVKHIFCKSEWDLRNDLNHEAEGLSDIAS